MERKKEFIDDVLITYFADLENKRANPILFKGKVVLPVGGLHMVKSDHPGRCELAGTVGSSGNFPSFYTETPSWEFKNLEYAGRLFRDPERSTYINVSRDNLQMKVAQQMIDTMIASNDPDLVQETQEDSGFTAKKVSTIVITNAHLLFRASFGS